MPEPNKIDTLILNANLATMVPGTEYGTIPDGALAVADGKIVWLGAVRDLPAGAMERAGTVHDLEGAWITPGLIDCHTHLVYGGDRAREFELRLKGANRKSVV